jgi:peptidoglycan/xylan/chitin deacetylase (PgdA/CDA1 family)
MDTDHPYELAVDGGGPLVEIPIQWALDDWEQYCYVPDFSGTGLIESPVKAVEMWRLEFDAMRAADGCFVLTNHPFLSGRPSRAQALDELIEYVCSHGDVWVTGLGAIAKHVRSLNLVPRSVERPDPRDF